MTLTESLEISLILRDPSGVAGDPRFSVVWLGGDQDASTKAALAAVIDRVTDLDDADVMVDLSDVTFMDTSIVGMLVRARNRLAACSRSLEVRSPSPTAARMLQLCGFALMEPAFSAAKVPVAQR